MDDRIHLPHCFREDMDVPEVPREQFETRQQGQIEDRFPAEHQPIENPNSVAAGEQLSHQDAADVAGSTDDQDVFDRAV